jgi:hypothetical protein
MGAIVGKNPGSAQALAPGYSGIQPIKLAGDKLLPTARNIILKACCRARIKIEAEAYIQVLNLFYLCDPSLSAAVKKFESVRYPKTCASENGHFPWVWFVWGKRHPRLGRLKRRFQVISTNLPFYYDQEMREVVTRVPGGGDHARHTQGLKHQEIVPLLAGIL